MDTRLNLLVFTAMLEHLKIKVHFKIFVQEFKAQNGFSKLFCHHHKLVYIPDVCFCTHAMNEIFLKTVVIKIL